jgi:alpha-tubulin suppressor-like RCC1 family protein
MHSYSQSGAAHAGALAAQWAGLRRGRWLAVIAASLVWLAGCGGAGGGDSSTAPAGAAPPVILEPPKAAAVQEGESAQFSVRANGAGLSYQWLRNGVEVPSATSPLMQLQAVSAADHNSRFQVRVSNAQGSAVSNEALLVVSAKPVVPLLTTAPLDQWVVAGQNAVFAATATGSGPLTYQWLRNGVAVPGATEPIYALPAQLSDDGARFSLTVSNAGGSVTSPSVLLRVFATQIPPVIAAAPANVQALAGGNALFAVSVIGTGPFEYQWLRDGTPITGATSPQLTLTQVQLGDHNAQFAVRVSNAAGNVVSAPAALLVSAAAASPSVTQHPQAVTANPGASAVFSAQASGTAPLSYQWFRNGVAINGATAPTYSLATLQQSDQGAQFTVQVTNAAGSALSFSALLTVTEAPVAPSIAMAPASVSVQEGANAAFYVSANGTAPLAYQWSKNGVAIPGAVHPLYVIENAATADDYASLRVTISNAAGQTTSSAATLRVMPVLSAPAISAQPQAQTLPPGATAQFNVIADGSGPLNYQWYRNGVAIAAATGMRYALQNISAADDGAVFTVVISNTAGSATSFGALLRVSETSSLPVITAHPQPVTASDGHTVAFEVAATGSGTLAYQWLRNGAPIAGATRATYVFTAQAADDGNAFSVAVTNAAGAATSNAAQLTVLPPASAPVITLAPQSVVSEYGSTIVLSVAAVGTGPLAYQWLRDGAPIAGATQSMYTLPSFELSDIGARISVVVSNSAGVAVSSVATLNLAPSQPQLAAGNWGYHLALAQDGRVFAWGDNSYGQLGLGDTLQRDVPNVIHGLTHIRKISAGYTHAAALRADGAVFIWGHNVRGQLGDGSTNPSLAPKLITSGVTEIELGYEFTLARTTTGQVYAWGRNDKGQLGNGGNTDSTIPVLVDGADNVIALAAHGSSSAFAITNDGHVLVWGENHVGQLGLGDTVNRNMPTQIAGLLNVTQIAAGPTHALALHGNGTVSAWGRNGSSELGDGSVTDRSTPAVIAGITDAVRVEVGGSFHTTEPANDFASFALRADGTVLAWGSNHDGQLGLGDFNDVDYYLPTASLITGVAGISVGYGHGVALHGDGSLVSWGRATTGGLGRPFTQAYDPSPSAIPGLDLTP